MGNTMQGVLAVPTTPFDACGEQNLDELAAGVDRVLQAGVDGILCLGATSEALTLSAAEREAQVRTVIDAARGRGHVVVGCMAYEPNAVTGMIGKAREWGADAVMITPPFYGGLDPDTVVDGLGVVLDSSDLPVMVYNNPHSTGVDILPEHLAQLSEHDSLWSVKETSGAASRVRELRAALRDDVEVFVGADGIALEGFVQGATGWVAASAWLAPDHCARLWQHSRDGQWADAVDLWRRLATPLALIEGNPAFISLIKQALGSLGRDQGPVRPPLPTVSPESVAAVVESLAKVERSIESV